MNSSFILVGIALDSKYSENEYFMEKLVTDRIVDVCDENNHEFDLVGKFIGIHEYNLNPGTMDLNSNFDGVLVNLQKYFPDTKKEDLKIYYGTWCGSR